MNTGTGRMLASHLTFDEKPFILLLMKFVLTRASLKLHTPAAHRYSISIFPIIVFNHKIILYQVSTVRCCIIFFQNWINPHVRTLRKYVVKLKSQPHTGNTILLLSIHEVAHVFAHTLYTASFRWN